MGNFQSPTRSTEPTTAPSKPEDLGSRGFSSPTPRTDLQRDNRPLPAEFEKQLNARAVAFLEQCERQRKGLPTDVPISPRVAEYLREHPEQAKHFVTAHGERRGLDFSGRTERDRATEVLGRMEKSSDELMKLLEKFHERGFDDRSRFFKGQEFRELSHMRTLIENVRQKHNRECADFTRLTNEPVAEWGRASGEIAGLRRGWLTEHTRLRTLVESRAGIKLQNDRLDLIQKHDIAGDTPWLQTARLSGNDRQFVSTVRGVSREGKNDPIVREDEAARREEAIAARARNQERQAAEQRQAKADADDRAVAAYRASMKFGGRPLSIPDDRRRELALLSGERRLKEAEAAGEPVVKTYTVLPPASGVRQPPSPAARTASTSMDAPLRALKASGEKVEAAAERMNADAQRIVDGKGSSEEKARALKSLMAQVSTNPQGPDNVAGRAPYAGPRYDVSRQQIVVEEITVGDVKSFRAFPIAPKVELFTAHDRASYDRSVVEGLNARLDSIVGSKPPPSQAFLNKLLKDASDGSFGGVPIPAGFRVVEIDDRGRGLRYPRIVDTQASGLSFRASMVNSAHDICDLRCRAANQVAQDILRESDPAAQGRRFAELKAALEDRTPYHPRQGENVPAVKLVRGLQPGQFVVEETKDPTGRIIGFSVHSLAPRIDQVAAMRGAADFEQQVVEGYNRRLAALPPGITTAALLDEAKRGNLGGEKLDPRSLRIQVQGDGSIVVARLAAPSADAAATTAQVERKPYEEPYTETKLSKYSRYTEDLISLAKVHDSRMLTLADPSGSQFQEALVVRNIEARLVSNDERTRAAKAQAYAELSRDIPADVRAGNRTLLTAAGYLGESADLGATAPDGVDVPGVRRKTPEQVFEIFEKFKKDIAGKLAEGKGSESEALLDAAIKDMGSDKERREFLELLKHAETGIQSEFEGRLRDRGLKSRSSVPGSSGDTFEKLRTRSWAEISDWSSKLSARVSTTPPDAIQADSAAGRLLIAAQSDPSGNPFRAQVAVRQAAQQLFISGELKEPALSAEVQRLTTSSDPATQAAATLVATQLSAMQADLRGVTEFQAVFQEIAKIGRGPNPDSAVAAIVTKYFPDKLPADNIPFDAAKLEAYILKAQKLERDSSISPVTREVLRRMIDDLTRYEMKQLGGESASLAGI